MEKNILVTGASGQLGGSVKRLWKESGWEGWQALFPSRAELDLSDEYSIRHYLQQHQPSIVLHAAAYTNVEEAEDKKDIAFLVNAQSCQWIAEECQKMGSWLIIISTDYVFDGKKGSPYDVEDAVNPLNVYGQSKYEGEQKALEAHHITTVVRVSWLYSTIGKNFFKTMLSLAKTRDQLNVVDDQWGAPTYARALARDLLSFLEKGILSEKAAQRVLHYSPQGETTWFGFASAILKQFYPEVKVNPVDSSAFPQKAKRPVYSKLNSQLWQELSRITPLTWQEQLNECIAVWKKDECN